MKIKKRVLGKSGIEISEIGLGLWAAGGGEWDAPNTAADATGSLPDNKSCQNPH